MICLGHFIIFMTYLTESQSEHAPVITKTPKDYYPRYGTLELSCQADGDPRPDISWYDDKTKQKVVDNIENKEFDYVVQIMRTGQLSRIIITEPDSQQEYKVYCNASNNLGYTVSPPATMGLAYLNDKFQINPASEKEAFSGTIIELMCKPPDGRPQPTVTWFKNGQQLSATNNPLHTVTTKPEGRSHYSILKIININSEDSGNYHCLAENSFGSVKSTTSHIKIIGSVAHSNIVKDVRFRISTNAKIQCPTKSFETVHWTRLDGHPIDTSHVSTEWNNLLIFDIRMSDSARYLCRVTSSNKGSPSEYIINVIVQDPATFAQPQEDKNYFRDNDTTSKKKDWVHTKTKVKNLKQNSQYQSKDLSRASVSKEYVNTLAKEVSSQTSNNDIKNQKLLPVQIQKQKRNPIVYNSSRIDEPTTSHMQSWFIPVIVIGIVVFGILLYCFMMCFCCNHCHLITKVHKLKQDMELISLVINNDSVNGSNVLCFNSEATSFINTPPCTLDI